MSRPRPRVIPLLLVHDGGLVKTTRFAQPRYIGDPINAIWIFNEKMVDEICILDMDASAAGRGPDFEFIASFANECFIPLCYGGGVTSLSQMERLFKLGVEKVSLNTAALANPKLITDAAARFGSQAVVVTMDVRKRGGRYAVYSHVKKSDVEIEPLAFARQVADAGAGELIVQNVDRDGTMQGIDTELVRLIAHNLTIPVVAAGGARDVDDLASAVVDGHAAAVAAGALFVYFGRRRGILINVPDEATRLKAFAGAVRGTER